MPRPTLLLLSLLGNLFLASPGPAQPEEARSGSQASPTSQASPRSQGSVAASGLGGAALSETGEADSEAEAYAVVGTGAALPPERARFEIHVGQRYLAQGLADRAAGSFERVTAAAPWHPGAWHLLSRARLAQGRHDEALAAARRALQAFAALPPQRQAAFQPATFERHLAAVLLAVAQPALASQALERAEGLAPGSSGIPLRLGEVLLDLGRDDEAAAAFRRAIERGSEEPATWLGYGKALLRLEQFEAAERALRQAEKLAPKSPEIQYALASVYRARGDFAAQEVALESFEALQAPALAAKRARDDIDALLRGAVQLQSEGDWSGARTRLEQALAHEHLQATGFRKHRALTDLARCQERLGESAAARRSYRLALAERPQSFTASFELGSLLAREGELEQAVPLLARASAVNPFDYAVHVNLALSWALLGRLNDAVGEIRRAATLQPEDLRVRQLLVDLQWAAGLEVQARAIAERLGGVLLPGEDRPASEAGREWAR